jgi:hypothetical protein
MSKLSIRASLACICAATVLFAMPASAQQQLPRQGLTPISPTVAEITPQSRAEIARRVLGIPAPIISTAFVTPGAPVFNNGQLVMSAYSERGLFSWTREEIWFRDNTWINLSFPAAASSRYFVICDLSGANVTWSARMGVEGATPAALPLVWESGRAVLLVPAGAARTVTVGLTATRPEPHATRAVLRRCEVSRLG